MKIAVILTAYDRMNSVISGAFRKSQATLSNFSKRADALAEKSFQTGQQLVAAGLAIGAPIYKAVEAATEFETKMVDIRKQMSDDTPTNVARMTEDIFKLGKELPLATGEIQEMIASGLRMGIAEDKIIGYTKNVTKMAVAFDMGAGEIADSMGKISGVFGIPIDKVGEFADVINYLDDSMMAKGPDIIDVLQRIGGSAKQLSPQTAAALASTMLSLGETSETAGTSINAMINRLAAANVQGKKFQDGLQMLGLDAANLQRRMADKSTAQFAMLEVFEKVKALTPEKQTEALIRLFGPDHGPKLMKLANNTGMLTQKLKELDKGAAANSMGKEYAKRVASSAAQMQIFKNRLQEVAVKAGTALLPTVNKLLASLGVWVDKIGTFISEHPELVAWIMKAAAAASALALVGGYLSFVVGGIAKLFSFAARTVSVLIRVFNFLKNVFMILRIVIMAFPLVGWVLAIATAAYFIIKHWSKIVAFFKGIFSNIKSQYGSFWGFLKAAGVMVFNFITWPIRMVLNFFKTTYKAFTQGGKGIIGSLIEGIKSALHIPVDMVKGMVKKIRNLLPFSPAKDGPLKDINRIRLVETIAESIKPASMINAMKRTAAAAMGFLTGRNFTGAAAKAVPAGGGGGVSMNVTINLSGGATQKDASMLTEALKKEFNKLMNQYNSGKARVSF